MKLAGFAIGIALTFAAAQAARGADALAPSTLPAAAAKPAEMEKISRPELPEATRPPLKLQVGDVRKYMMPKEYSALIDAPDAEKTTIIVEGRRELLPMKSEQPVPVGIVTPFWMIANPLSAWRALVPDLKAPPPGPPDPVPPRVFRWGP